MSFVVDRRNGPFFVNSHGALPTYICHNRQGYHRREVLTFEGLSLTCIDSCLRQAQQRYIHDIARCRAVGLVEAYRVFFSQQQQWLVADGVCAGKKKQPEVADVIRKSSLFFDIFFPLKSHIKVKTLRKKRKQNKRERPLPLSDSPKRKRKKEKNLTEQGNKVKSYPIISILSYLFWTKNKKNKTRGKSRWKKTVTVLPKHRHYYRRQLLKLLPSPLVIRRTKAMHGHEYTGTPPARLFPSPSPLHQKNAYLHTEGRVCIIY